MKEKARRLYRRFHQFDPRKIKDYDLAIPEEIFHVGEAMQVLYRSDKLNPETGEDEGMIDYFHDHEGGVKFHLVDDADDEDSRVVKMPTKIRRCKTVVVLGKCLGFTFKDFNGNEVRAKGTSPYPELVALPPEGKILLVVQNKRKVIAAIWGGSLAVKPEGIVG